MGGGEGGFLGGLDVRSRAFEKDIDSWARRILSASEGNGWRDIARLQCVDVRDDARTHDLHGAIPTDWEAGEDRASFQTPPICVVQGQEGGNRRLGRHGARGAGGRRRNHLGSCARRRCGCTARLQDGRVHDVSFPTGAWKFECLGSVARRGGVRTESQLTRGWIAFVQVSGKVDQSAGMLSEDVIAQGYALLCVSSPETDCRVKIIEEEELLNVQLVAGEM